MKVVKAWLPLAFAISVLAGLIYVTGQQILRQSANDPQVQLARDWASRINGGTLPTQLEFSTTIDPTKSLAPFGMVFDAQGKVVASSVKDPEALALPDGVLASVDKSTDSESHFTWEPIRSQRFAVDIKKTHGGDNADYYVLAGRNLLEVEKREAQLLALAAFAWLVAMAGSFYLQSIAWRGSK